MPVGRPCQPLYRAPPRRQVSMSYGGRVGREKREKQMKSFVLFNSTNDVYWLS